MLLGFFFRFFFFFLEKYSKKQNKKFEKFHTIGGGEGKIGSFSQKKKKKTCQNVFQAL